MWNRYVAEFSGTFLMVLLGCGSIALGWSPLAVSITFGVAVFTAIMIFQPISGAHINPAVSIAFWFRGNLSNKDTIAHVLGQLTGALCAGLLLDGAGPTVRNTSWINLVGIEILITFLLMASILWIIRQTEQWIPIATVVGATVAILAFLFGQYTGASMNPARTFGPNLISGNALIIPVYFACTIIGAWLAVVAERLIPSTSG